MSCRAQKGHGSSRMHGWIAHLPLRGEELLGGHVERCLSQQESRDRDRRKGSAANSSPAFLVSMASSPTLSDLRSCGFWSCGLMPPAGVSAPRLPNHLSRAAAGTSSRRSSSSRGSYRRHARHTRAAAEGTPRLLTLSSEGQYGQFTCQIYEKENRKGRKYTQ
jgi:hypothetical protein